ncbi:MAG: carboxy terminal-processing peptidase, partial [Flavisolibacter sp.]
MKSEFADFENGTGYAQKAIQLAKKKPLLFYFSRQPARKSYIDHLKFIANGLILPKRFSAIMNRRLLCASFLILTSLPLFAQGPKAQQVALILKRQIERLHFNPRPVNDSFSSEVFTKVLKELDEQQTIFTADDYNVLSAYRYKIDDELNGAPWKFADVISDLYRQRLKRADSLTQSILQKPLDLSADDKITFTTDEHFQFAATIAELRTRWTKWFKYMMLESLDDLQEADSTKPALKTLLAENESSIREKIRKATARSFTRLLDPAVYASNITEAFYNSVATTFDPHTMFFSPDQKEEFQSEVSSENLSFGFDIDETKDGKIVVAGLVPGGPAWRTGEIHVNDELLQIEMDGKQALDVSTIGSDEVVNWLKQSNHSMITFKMKKANGTVYSVALQKEKIEKQDDVVKGYVLNGAKKIGYVSLPGFYTTWEDEKGSGCANDLAKEIVRLKKENVEGLILDVRFNGGGSLEEALQLAGIFIDEGPLTGVRDKTGKLVFLKDPNRGTVYDGPLVLMVNGQSASASELLAAALQDYNRAVLVGSPTYGKATMQQVFPMDTLMNNPSAPSPNGYVKITEGKLYRVTGQTAQLNGVTPDIQLPDAFDALHYGERFTVDALRSDTVKRNAYFKPLDPLPVSQLRQSSSQRLSDNQRFQQINTAIGKRKSEESSARVIPLKLESFEKWAKDNNTFALLYGDKHGSPGKIFVPQNHKDESQQVSWDAYAKTLNEGVLKNIQQDIYIEEAYQIILDLIKLQ